MDNPLDLRDVLGTEHMAIAKAWNELKSTGLTRGLILRGEEGQILERASP
jgi:hypothetical protein